MSAEEPTEDKLAAYIEVCHSAPDDSYPVEGLPYELEDNEDKEHLRHDELHEQVFDEALTTLGRVEMIVASRVEGMVQPTSRLWDQVGRLGSIVYSLINKT